MLCDVTYMSHYPTDNIDLFYMGYRLGYQGLAHLENTCET